MAWTPIDADTSWQDLAVAQEIATAYNLRADACGAAHIEASGAVRVFDFVKAAQDGIKSMIDLHAWANPSATVSGSTFVSRFANFQAFMIHAGLPGDGTYNGWRRAVTGHPAEWNVYANWSTFGDITSEDEAGPWLFADLQTALSAMTRMVAQTNPDAYSASASGYGAPPTLYPAVPSFSASGSGAGIYILRQKVYGDPINQDVSYDRYPAAQLDGLISASKTIRLYVLPQESANFYDFGLGMTELEYKLWYTWPSNTAASVSTPVLGVIDDWDWIDSYLPWSAVGANETVERQFSLAGGAFWIIDYDFNP